MAPRVWAQGLIAIGQTVSGELTAASATYGDGRRYALWTFLGSAGQRVEIDMTSTELDSYLILQDQDARQLASNDDGGGDNNSHISITVPYTGMYRILAMSFRTSGVVFGKYTLSMTGTAGAHAMPMPDSLWYTLRSPHGREYPQFPWPPPPATTRDVIPRGLVTRPTPAGVVRTADTLGTVADSIEDALRRARIEWAVYFIGDSGFVYVTRAEMIRRTGEPLPPPRRFPEDLVSASGSGGFLDFIVSRFRARAGLYRIIAIVVTSRPIVPGGGRLTADSATALVHGGMATVPPAVRRRVVRDLQAEAHVYEFERPGGSETVSLRASPLVSAREHLAAAGLWTPGQLLGMR